MKSIITNINKVFESRIRLGIMSALSVNEKLDFNSLKELLELTDGNLASHIKALEKEEYIDVEKKFIARKPKTFYKITEIGLSEFKKHLNALEILIKNQK